jgi:hypothetical protein
LVIPSFLSAPCFHACFQACGNTAAAQAWLVWWLPGIAGVLDRAKHYTG